MAGPALYFLIIDWFICWGILAAIEYGYLRTFLNRFRNPDAEL